MAFDPYALCPCGSGKKMKFCCQAIADDMERIQRQIENNQLRSALSQLEALDKRQPQNEWITTTRALILIETGDFVSARDLLQSWVAAHPESDFGICLYATAHLHADGYDAAKKSVQRAFQKGAKTYPALVSGLAGSIAAEMEERNQPLAVRECLSLALRFAPEHDRQELFIRLLEFDNGTDIYYPLRSLHPLPAVEVPPEHEKDYKRSLKLATIGCWDVAADGLTSLADKLPELVHLRLAAGLCRAWDGDATRAAQLLHQVATQLTDFPVAVECETLAQLLDMDHIEPKRAMLATDGEVPSVSRLLSVLDQQPRLIRLPVRPNPQPGALNPSAIYQVLDRAALSAAHNSTAFTRNDLPIPLGQIAIYDATQEHPARIVLSALSGTKFDGAWEHLRSIAGDQIQWSTEAPESLFEVPQELDIFSWQWSFPPKTPLGVRHDLDRQQWQEVLCDLWPNQPQQALQGKSPKAAVSDPALRLAVTAAVYVLDAICDHRKYSLDVPALCQQLGLEPLPELTLSAESQPNALSLIQLHRLKVTALTDAQLGSVVNRALLIHHDSFLKPVLEEALKRPGCVPDLELTRVYQTLVDLNARHGKITDAFRWIDEARQRAIAERANFEVIWQWDLRELMLRLTNPADPGLKPLLHKFVTYYSPKVPQMRSYLEIMLAEAGVDSPWSGGGIITPDMTGDAITSGAVWSPDQPAAAAAGGSKLWLPGQ